MPRPIAQHKFAGPVAAGTPFITHAGRGGRAAACCVVAISILTAFRHCSRRSLALVAATARPPPLEFGPLQAAGDVHELGPGADPSAGLLCAQAGGPGTGLPPVLRVRGVLREAEAASVVSMAEDAAAGAGQLSYNTDPDDIDGEPSYELYPLYRARWQHDAVEAVFRPAVEERLLPFVQRAFDCPGCVPCDALLRRYCPGERRYLPAHEDFYSRVTAVFPLNPSDYEGGLFVEREPGGNHTGPAPRFLRRGPALTDARREALRGMGLLAPPRRQSLEGPELKPGDALVHDAKLLHGVEILDEGCRYSLVLWFYESMQECLDATPLQ